MDHRTQARMEAQAAVFKALAHPTRIWMERTENTDYRHEGRLRTARHCTFQYTLRGEGIFRDASGEYRVPVGSGFLAEVADPEVVYFYPESASEPWEWVYFDFYGAKEVVQEMCSEFGAIYQIDKDSAVIEKLLSYERYRGRALDVDYAEAATLVMEVLGALAAGQLTDEHVNPHARLVQRAQALVEANLLTTNRDVTVSGLASMLRVSREHLCRVFKRQVGRSPAQYITEEKMHAACRLLKESDLKCLEIAELLGFSSGSNFARTFRRLQGVSPSHYRKTGVAPKR